MFVFDQPRLDFRSLTAVPRVAADIGSEPKEGITITAMINAL
jgi:hypothetical protein